MDIKIKVRRGSGFAAFLVCMLVFLCSTCFANNEEHNKKQKQCLWKWQSPRDAYNIYSELFTTRVTQYWGFFKALANDAYTRLFPPNIDFRSGGGVKEAVAKSLGSSKDTVEDAAKSAAEKVKSTFSADDQNHKRNEL
ncbi:Transmembrane protein, putative [Arachis hypogaea]|nr:Transmembrane protein, putative [Arachis hypogaea]